VVVEKVADENAAQVAPSSVRQDGSTPAAIRRTNPVETGGAHGERISSERSHSLRGDERRTARSQGHGYAGSNAREPNPERTSSAGGRRVGQEKRTERVAPTRPDPAGGQGSTGRAGPRTTAPTRPETQSRAVPQTKDVPPATVEEIAPALPVPDAPPAPGQKAATPQNLK
jgi:hypothetical protein